MSPKKIFAVLQVAGILNSQETFTLGVVMEIRTIHLSDPGYIIIKISIGGLIHLVEIIGDVLMLRSDHILLPGSCR